MSLYKKVGESNPTYLLSDPQGADKIAIPCTPGNGVVARGTVMYREDSGMYAPATAADVIATKSLVVVDETVDTDANASVAEDAAAYRAGRMIAGKVLLKDGSAPDAAAVLVLRQQGIVLNQMVDTAPEFNNEVGG